MVESSLVTYNKCIIDYQKGSSTRVEFDFMRIWNFKQLLGKYFDPSKLLFYHVHPSGMLEYSLTDINCMQGFQMSLGYSVGFGVISFHNKVIDNLQHTLKMYRYYKAGNFIMETTSIGLEPAELEILKILSYGGEV